MIDLKPEEIRRYARHLVLPEVGLAGQGKLKDASVLIVGCGGLGAPIALYLAAAGIGRIGLVDYDTIEISNLQRQVIYSTHLVGESKVRSARSQLLAINPEISVEIYEELFTSQNAEEIAAPYQFIIDGTDNIPTRYLLNDLGVLKNKPYIYGAVHRFSGQAAIFDSSRGACYRCIFPMPPRRESVPTCAVAGVMGVTPGVIGLLQASEVIKLILGIGKPLISRMLLYDALECTTQTVNIPKNPACKACGEKPKIRHLIDYEAFCQMSVQNHGALGEERLAISPQELRESTDTGKKWRIIDVREPVETEIAKIPGSENIPFHFLPEVMFDWDKQNPIVLVCHIGFLSSIACEMLAEAGFEEARHLKGGLRDYARQIDPSLQIY